MNRRGCLTAVAAGVAAAIRKDMAPMTDDQFLVQMLNAGGTWSDVVGRRPMGIRLMQKGLIELIKPPTPFLPYAVLTSAGEKRAHDHDEKETP